MQNHTADSTRVIPLSQGTVANVLEKHRRVGLQPTVAPKIILQSPLWQDPQYAGRHVSMRRRWKDLDDEQSAWVAELVNVLPKDPSEPAPSWGLLRYLDLDVTMVLSLQWTLTGSRNVEIEQRDLLRRMGYACLESAPYDELHASLRRLSHTKVAVFREGTPNHQVEPWQIIDDSQRSAPGVPGSGSVITARISRLWEDALVSGTWQAVDLNAYSYLVRVARRNGLARILYLYLASWRDGKAGFDVPLYGIINRFAQRRSDGRLRYFPLSDPRCLLRKALDLLQANRVIQITRNIDGEYLESARLSGRFLETPPPELPTMARQLAYLAPSLWIQNEVSEVPALPTSSITPHSVESTATEWSVVESTYCEQTLSILLDRFSPALPRQRIKVAREGGWEIRQLWVAIGLVLWKWEAERSVENPAGFLQSILKSGMADPTYRKNFRKATLHHQIPISGSEWLAWILNGPLREFPMPKKSPNVASITSEAP